jgi:copper chaperone
MSPYQAEWQLLIRSTYISMATLHLTIPDMACSACVDTITQSVQTVDASATVQTDLQTKAVTITTRSEPTAVKQAIADAGYTVQA